MYLERVVTYTPLFSMVQLHSRTELRDIETLNVVPARRCSYLHVSSLITGTHLLLRSNLISARRLATLTPSPVTEPPLKGFQILLIICAILFLSLLLLGLGCSYMCLKRRNVRVVHRHPFESGTGSEITKLSGSTLSNITMFEGLKIPRAHALLHATAASTSGSEANLVIDHSDTLPSDYPSESHSEVSPGNCLRRRMIEHSAY